MRHSEVISGQLLDKSLEEKKTLAAASLGRVALPMRYPRAPMRFQGLPLRSPKVFIQFLEVSMKSRRVP